MPEQPPRPGGHDPNLPGPTRPGRRFHLGFALLFGAVVAILVLYPYYKTYVAPWSQPVIAVRDEVFDMRYLVGLLRLYGPDRTSDASVPAQIIVTVQNNELARQEAVRRGIRVGADELESALRRRVSEGDEEDFPGRYRDLLNRTGLSDAEYRRLVESDLYATRLVEALGREVPGAAEQVHAYGILVEDAKRAEELRREIRGPGDFERLAAEHSRDPESSRQGGDLGWWPKGVRRTAALPHARVVGILSRTEPEAREALGRLQKGEPFAVVAREVSQDHRSAGKGGDLGWVREGALGRELDAALAGLPTGRVSEPVRTPDGYWLVRAEERAPAGNLIDDIAFGLAEGEVTPPLLTPEGYYLLRVAERAAQRDLAPAHRDALKAKAMEAWLQETSRQGAKEGWIKWHWDSDRYAWAMEHVK